MTRGGKRLGAGRPPRAGSSTDDTRVTVRLTEAERAEIEAATADGESVSDVLREGGLQLARRRR